MRTARSARNAGRDEGVVCPRRRGRTRAQTTVEYAVLVLVTVGTVMGAVLAVRSAVIDFYYDVVSVICLPFP